MMFLKGLLTSRPKMLIYAVLAAFVLAYVVTQKVTISSLRGEIGSLTSDIATQITIKKTITADNAALRVEINRLSAVIAEISAKSIKSSESREQAAIDLFSAPIITKDDMTAAEVTEWYQDL